MIKELLGSAALLIATGANAGLIAEYDFDSASGTTQGATTVGAGFTATDLELNNADNSSAAFSNHFYHNGWDSGLNTNKYYELTVGSLSLSFIIDEIAFSLEELGGSPSDWFFRTSLDGFSSDFASGSFGGGQVTNFSIDATSLGVVSSPITFRWYLTADNLSERAGFANHDCPVGAGCGLSDAGQDLSILGQIVTVPEPASVAFLGLGLVGLLYSRKRK
tara:strand:+ start:1485 stop:2144 length:660 start_codon:yes stop_codon:yes gene_type:complete